MQPTNLDEKVVKIEWVGVQQDAAYIADDFCKATKHGRRHEEPLLRSNTLVKM